MRYNKFILYYPDLSLGGSEKSKDDTEMEQYSPDKTPQSKKITALKVQNDSRFIDAGGENRVISIIGTVDAGFTLTIKDSSGCSIMEEELEDVKIPKGGVYKFHQNFPSIIIDAGGGLIEEYYEVIITPHADVEVNEPIKRTQPKIGRNDKIQIKKGKELKTIKFKKAEPFLNDGWEFHALAE